MYIGMFTGMFTGAGGFRFRWSWFLGSFLVGVLVVAATSAQPTAVVRFPTPWTPRMVYRDELDGGCVRFDAEEVECRGDEPEHPPAVR